jgi:hypothetical protein
MVAAAAVVALVGLGACTGGGADDDGADQATVKNSAADGATTDVSGAGAVASAEAFRSSGAAGGGSAANAATAPQADAAASVADTDEAAGAPLPQGIGAPRVIKTAAIEIEVPKGRFDAAFSKMPTIAAGLGGFVSSSTSSQAAETGEDGEHRQAAGSVVLRVPADQFDTARTQLIALGDLRSQQLKGDDVSAQLTDLDARLRNLRSQEEAIRLLMTKTKTIGETIEVQRQLSGVREQIEQLSAEQARLGDAVAMSTLTLTLAEPGAVAKTEGEPSPLGQAFSRAFDGAQDVLAGVIVTLGYLVPLALLLALGWLAARPFVAGRRNATPEPAVSSS